MIKIVIVEDDIFYLSFLEKKLSELGKYEILGVADSVIGAYNIIRAKIPDIILSDINLKGKNNGIDLGNMIADRDIPIVFMTESEEDALYRQASELHLISFLVKPFHILTLDSTIASLLNLKSAGTQVKGLIYSSGGNRVLLHNDDILYISADKNYCTVFTDQKRYAYKISLTRLQQKLNPDIFIQVHKSTIVNRTKIKNLDFKENVLYVNDHQIAIGRTFKKYLNELFAN